MRAGELRHRITVEQKSVTRNDYGEEIASWSEFATRWADAAALDGTESFSRDQKFAEATHRFRLRYLDGVDAEMRVSWRGRTFDIVSALDPDGMKRETVIVATERTDA